MVGKFAHEVHERTPLARAVLRYADAHHGAHWRLVCQTTQTAPHEVGFCLRSPSPIRTVTVGSGFAPVSTGAIVSHNRYAARGQSSPHTDTGRGLGILADTLPPVGNFTLPRRLHLFNCVGMLMRYAHLLPIMIAQRQTQMQRIGLNM